MPDSENDQATQSPRRGTAQKSPPRTQRRQGRAHPARNGNAYAGNMAFQVARAWVQANPTTALVASFAVGVMMGSAMED